MTRRQTWLITGLPAVGVGAGIAALVLIPALRDDGGAEDSRPNILLVSFDTTRADRLGAYGWRHARTPAIDGLAREGVLFTHAYAPVPLTLPSHAAMMTGLPPFELLRMSEACRNAARSSPISTKAACMPGSTRQVLPL